MFLICSYFYYHHRLATNALIISVLVIMPTKLSLEDHLFYSLPLIVQLSQIRVCRNSCRVIFHSISGQKYAIIPDGINCCSFLCVLATVVSAAALSLPYASSLNRGAPNRVLTSNKSRPVIVPTIASIKG